MTTTPTTTRPAAPTGQSAGRGLPRWLATRLVITASTCLLVVGALGSATTPDHPAAAAKADDPAGSVAGAHPFGHPPMRLVAHTSLPTASPPSPSAAGSGPLPGFAAAAGSLQCNGRALTRRGEDRASATGFQIDVVLDRDTSGSTDRRRGPLVISCGRDGDGGGILACTTKRRGDSTSSRNRHRDPSYDSKYDRDRDVDYDLDDYEFDLDDLDRWDWGRGRLDRIDMRDLEDLINGRAVTGTGHHMAGLDINIGGLVGLLGRNGRDTTNARPGDLFDLFPDTGYRPSDDRDPNNRDRDRDRTDREDRSRRGGVCRWIGR